MTSIEVTLTKSEHKIVIGIAKKRIKNNREKNFVNTPYGGVKQEEIEINSYGAEIAYCKHFNIFPELSLELEEAGVDAMHDGKRVDIKNAPNGGTLLANINRDVDDCDVFALVCGIAPNYFIAGWCHSQDLIDDKNIEPLTDDKIPTYKLPAGKLKLFEATRSEELWR